MSVTIAKGATTITPALVLGYRAETDSLNVVHRKIGGGIDVSLADDTPRTGTLTLFFLTRAEAWAAQALHATAGSFTLTDSDLPQTNMNYVRDGKMEIALDDQTLTRWLVTVGFQEVSA